MVNEMKFNPQHAIEHKEKFAALKWCIENAKLNIDEDGYRGYVFEGAIPHYQLQRIFDLKKLGYKHPSDNEILNINWVVGSKYHGIGVSFQHKKVKLTHNVYELTEDELKQYQAA
jgi:hypothetical protein